MRYGTAHEPTQAPAHADTQPTHRGTQHASTLSMQACAVDVLKGALQGYNGTIMAYGQTGKWQLQLCGGGT